MGTCAHEDSEETALLQAKMAVDGPTWNGKGGNSKKSGKGKKGGFGKKGKKGKKDSKDFMSGGDGSLCGIEGFSTYGGYTGDLRVSGKLWVKMFDGPTQGQELTFRLNGVDPQCANGPGTSPNSCGVHITEDSSCANAGPSFWNKQAVTNNPWGALAYTSWVDSTGEIVTGMVKEQVTTGLTGKEVIGRTVVVHDFHGARIACAPLVGFSEGNPPTTMLIGDLGVKEFASATGGWCEVEGKVALHEKPGMSAATAGVFLSLKLTGLDARCSKGPGDVENSCGVRLHEGTSCWNPAGHLYNSKTLLQDPWSQVSYVSAQTRKQGIVAEIDRINVNLGLSAKDISGRVLMVYDFFGKPLGCGKVE